MARSFTATTAAPTGKADMVFLTQRSGVRAGILTRIAAALAAFATAAGVSCSPGAASTGDALPGSELSAQSSLLTGSGVEPFGTIPPVAGVVHFEKIASSDFDREDKKANAAWIGQHFTRMLTYSPFFDSRTRWYPNAWAYRDSYAIYVGSSLAARHPSWILKDAHGSPLYIPYGSPPAQYAADISNPAYRRYWIAKVKATLARGYRGVMVDDVNMWADTGNARDERTVPISGVTHRPISNGLWREYMVTFMRELRAAIPTYEIVHNSIWYANGGAANRGTTSAIVREQIEAADGVVIERGVNDSGLTSGNGPWSLSNLFTYIDEVHAIGRSVILAGGATGVPAMEYNLAAYFLVSNGRDFVAGGGDSQTVKHFWPGWSLDLGAALGPRYPWNGLLRRDFEGGSVYLNPPGGQTVTVGGRTLAGASGAIIPSS